MAAILFFTCALAVGTLQAVSSSRIILNEEELINTCTGTCDDIPTLYDKNGCVKLAGCKTSSVGWDKGFVRCDYCTCNCEKNTPDKDILVETKKLSVVEEELYGTCTGECPKRGAVRTNFKGCQEVHDCAWEANGWLKGFVRCDYCTCQCTNKKESRSYTLKNVYYDMSGVNLKEGRPLALADTILENASPSPQTVTRVLTYTDTHTVSLTSSHNLGLGLKVIVEASAGIEGIGTIKTSVERSLTYGYTTTAGSSNTTSTSDQIRATVEVPAKSTITAKVIGHRITADVPYKADLVTTYTDGSTSTKAITGVYTSVDTGRFRVQYEAPKPL